MHRASFSIRAFTFAILPLCLAVACGDDDDDDHQGHLNPEGIGNACDSDDDCDTDDCYLGPGGGYCTTECQDEGSTGQCPFDTVCKPIQGGPSRCLLVCGSESACDGIDRCSDDYCPDGSSCVSVDSTDLRACEPDPV